MMSSQASIDPDHDVELQPFREEDSKRGGAPPRTVPGSFSQRICQPEYKDRWFFGSVFGFALVLALIVGVMPPSYPTSDMFSRFRASCTAEGARSSLQTLTQAAHLAGTAADQNTAKFVQQAFLDAGIPDVVVEEYEVLLNQPNPNAAIVQIMSPANEAFTAALHEAAMSQDPLSSTNYAGPFNGYAPSGDVTAKVVYCNYGRVEDFAYLKSIGVSVNGSIALMRYGQIFRGNKVENAQVNGAVAAIIYSDPANDGFTRGPVLPNGPFRPDSSVQRGSVFTGEGDPLTPGMPSTSKGLHWTIWEARQPNDKLGWSLPTIPSIPISYGDAQPILASLGGATVPNDWTGGLPITYRFGAGPSTVRVKVSNTFTVTKIWNVLGKVPGSIEPDRWVVLGNHRDAWVGGAVDPSSGTATQIEVAKGLGALVRGGWQPQRSILLASWDAEEYGLVGSVEFVERHAHKLATQAVAYLNVDSAVSGMGPISAAACPSLTNVLYEVAKTVPQPPCVPFPVPNQQPQLKLCSDVPAGATVYDFWLSKRPATGNANVPQVNVMGSGSDQTGFIAHLGVTALDMEFSAEQSYYAVYHSVYDSFYWMSMFGDPTFQHHEAAAELWGSLGIRLASDPVLPFDFVPYGQLLQQFVTGLTAQVQQLGGSDATPISGVQPGESDGVPDHVSPSPVPKTLDLTRLTASVQRFVTAAASAAAEGANLIAANPAPSALVFRAYNDRLMYAERAFIVPEGLPGRSWLKHVLFSPSAHNSYGATSFPAVSDALTDGNWRLAQEQLDVICHLMQRATDALNGSNFEFDPTI